MSSVAQPGRYRRQVRRWTVHLQQGLRRVRLPQRWCGRRVHLPVVLLGWSEQLQMNQRRQWRKKIGFSHLNGHHQEIRGWFGTHGRRHAEGEQDSVINRPM